MMAVYIGDHGPLVVTMQVLLNRHGGGSPIKADGSFGPVTQEAVRQFQHVAKIPTTGKIDDITWEALSKRAGVCAIDAVDIYDRETMRAGLSRAAGPNLIQTGGLSNGVQSVIERILERSNDHGRIAVLRFLGHGGYGATAVSGGSRTLRDSEGKTLYQCRTGRSPGPGILEHNSCEEDVMKRNSITKKFERTAINAVGYDPWLERVALSFRPGHAKDSREVASSQFHAEIELKRLCSRFEPYGVLEMHGCMAAAGHDGEVSMRRLVGITGVPVAAGTKFQTWSSRDDYAPRLEPPIRYFYPKNLSLKVWASQFK